MGSTFSNKEASGLVYICGVMVIVAAAAGCQLRGYFFTEEAYPFLIAWFASCAMVALLSVTLLGRRMEWEGNRWSLRVGRAAFLVILLIYGLHLLHGRLSLQATLDEILRWVFYGSFAWVALHAARHRGSARLLTFCWNGLGLVLSLSALMSLFPQWKLPYAIAYSHNAGVSVTGARLAGLLEYPNTFGAVMAAFLLERLFAIANRYAEKREGVKAELAVAGDVRGRYAMTSHSGRACCAELLSHLPLFPYTAALLLSESRGAWLAAACACAAVLALQRRLLVPLLLTGAAPAAAAALCYRQWAAAGLAVPPLPGLLTLAGAWAGAALAGLWLLRRWHSAAQRAAALTLAAAAWTAAGTAVLAHVSARITGPSSTVAARGLMYRDALRLAGEAPWLGQGGGTWRNLYLAVQSRPYVGSQVHSGYLDLLLNVGSLGLAAVLLLLVAAGWSIRKAPRWLAPFLVLVLHSAVDFDWSYGLIWLMMLWLPAMAVLSRAEERPASSLLPMQSAGHVYNKYRLLPGMLRVSLCLTLAFLAYRGERGAIFYRAAQNTSTLTEQTRLLEESLKWNPLSSRTVLALSRAVPAQRRDAVLMDGLRYSPKDAALRWELAKYHLVHGKKADQVLYSMDMSLRGDLYNVAKWTKAVEGMWQRGHDALQSGKNGEARKYADAGLKLLSQYRLLTESGGESGAAGNDRRFRMTAEAEAAGQKLQWLMARDRSVSRKDILPE